MKYIVKPILRTILVLICYLFYPIIFIIVIFDAIWELNFNWYRENIKNEAFWRPKNEKFLYKKGIDFILNRKTNY